MEFTDVMSILEGMKVAVFATVDAEGKPHSRPMYIGVANELGVFFMTNRETACYHQLMADNHLSITAMTEEDYLIQLIRMEGRAKPVSPRHLQELLQENPYVDYVYPDSEAQENIQVFQLYEGTCTYHSLTQGHRYRFTLGGEALAN